jgi:hypothetical protein
MDHLDLTYKVKTQIILSRTYETSVWPYSVIRGSNKTVDFGCQSNVTPQLC